MRSAIVVGATGLVGSALIKLLCESEEYVSITAIARRKLDYEHPKLTVKIRSFDELGEQDIDYAQELYCCLGTTMKKAGSKSEFEKVDFEYPLHIASLAKKRGIMHLIVISAMSANDNSSIYYNRVKGKLEKELITLDLPQLSIVRPSLLVGDRSEFRLGEKMGELVLNVVNPLLIGPAKKLRSIEANQVALAMKVIALHGKKEPVSIYESQELANMAMPQPEEEEEISREQLFNWSKLEQEQLPPLDDEVMFDHAKLREKEVKRNNRNIED
ncbi:NAD-dependent epimerase/dehydratase family protein [Lysinibacillus antri]|uniref:NAD-dependent epimerase/dehydratase family protein n=1 Tax=Lysinibacillus antri TaxID=2498145 RepID=A0A3S0P360_9BACI|nr:NAD-dependent epimerase/dehydratase family protein [Lysinibacillus antri]RUL50816.1 NAD-dependent epimerase/dehydratase family protein [Lysinibacillus antri]